MGDIEDAPKSTSFASSFNCRSPSLNPKCGSCGPKVVDRRKHAVNPISTSVFELFKVGIGPSSSHTVGPMIASRNFAKLLATQGLLDHVVQVMVELRGSLALTGIGHGTPKAVILGLHGLRPSEVDPDAIDPFLKEVADTRRLVIGFNDDRKEIEFEDHRDILLVADELPLHPNALICRAYADGGAVLKEVTYYSTGGGFVLTEEEMRQEEHGVKVPSNAPPLPIPWRNMSDLVEICATRKMTIAEVMRTNEEARIPPDQVVLLLEELWEVMDRCVQHGLEEGKTGLQLPGPLGVSRRAPGLYRHAQADTGLPLYGLMDELRWLDCYTLAVMEENACMGRVVTAPTNGAAGVVPGVLAYYMRHVRPKQPEDRRGDPATFLLTAAAVGILAKEHASISGAAGGCQAEVGTATAMAAAGLCAVLGGTPEQVEEAAEIALEHCLGMTCDPVLGLVQVPCIERNTMGASKALNAVALVLKSPVSQRRSMLRYDDVLRVMKATGADMDSRYRETALGGLAADYEEGLQSDAARLQVVSHMMDFARIQRGTQAVANRSVSVDDLTTRLMATRTQHQAKASC